MKQTCENVVLLLSVAIRRSLTIRLPLLTWVDSSMGGGQKVSERDREGFSDLRSILYPAEGKLLE